MMINMNLRPLSTITLSTLLFAGILHADDAAQRFNFATGLLIKEEFAMAATEFKALLQATPDFQQADVARYRLAEALQKGGDSAAAITAFQELLAKHPQSERLPQTHYWLAQLLAATEPAAAANHYQTIVTKWPTHQLAEAAAYGVVETDFKAAAWEATIAASDQLLKLFPKSEHASHALYTRGWAATQLEKWDLALATFDQLVKEHPDATFADEARLKAAQAQQHLGKADDALARFTALAAGTGTLALDALLEQATLHFQQGRYAAAATAFNQAAAKLDDDPRQPPALMNAGQASYAVTNDQQAIAAFTQLRQQHPQHPLAPEAGYWLAQSQLRHNALDDALATTTLLLKTPDLTPDRSFNLHLLQGEIETRRKNSEAAAASYAAALAAMPDNPLIPDLLYRLGRHQQEHEQHAAARTHFQQLYQKYATHQLAAEAAYRDGVSAAALDDTAAAAAAYTRATELSPESTPAIQAALALILFSLKQQEYAAALQQTDAFIARHTASPLLTYALLYRAEALSHLERFEEALKQYQAPPLQDGPTATDAQVGIAWNLFALKRYPEAAAAYAKLLTAPPPQSLDAAYMQARAFEAADDFANARTTFTAVANDNRQPQERRAAAAYSAAVATWRGGAPAEALPLLAAIAKEQPASPYAARALYDQAWILQEDAKVVDAAARFQELVTRFPADPLAADAHFRLGEIAYDQADYATAVAAYEAALAGEAPSFANDVRYKLAWACEKLERSDDAIKTFAALIADNADHPYANEARYRQARLLINAGKHDDALPLLAAIPTDSPFAEQAQLLLAETQRGTNRQREALASYERILQEWPNGTAALQAQLGRAHTLRDLGAHRDALEAYQLVINGDQPLESAHATLGQGYCHFAMQQWEEAAKAFLKVDILYGVENLKPEALDQLAATWEKAGDTAKAARYREERTQRYPEQK